MWNIINHVLEFVLTFLTSIAMAFVYAVFIVGGPILLLGIACAVRDWYRVRRDEYAKRKGLYPRSW
jgi:hypothetical protein